MRRVVLLLALLVSPARTSAQAPSGNTITIGKIDSIFSPTLKENRKFWVYTPASYNDTTYLPQKYPVLYLLDGNAHFHSVTGLLQILGSGINGTFVVPEMIVVAIPNTDRLRDMSPSHVEKNPDGSPAPGMKTSGGMPNFLSFIQRELIPKIESGYRTAPYRVFVGHSLGGITAIDALYTMPETFNAYVAIDPSLWWDSQLLLKKARTYFGKPGLSGRALYVAQANTINPNDTSANVHFASIVQFNSILEQQNKSGIRYDYKYYPADSHGSVPLIAEYDALRFIFSTYNLNLLEAMERPAYLAEHFAAVSSSLGYKVLPPEPLLDLVGHVALGRDTTKALEVFRTYAELYPNSAKALEALGDGWTAKGDKAKATDFYQRSLAIRPNNPQAKEKMRKLAETKQ
jgi:uncharacterized protein